MIFRTRFAPALLLLLLPRPSQASLQQAAQAAPSEFERADASGRVRVHVKETIIGFNDPSMNEESFVSSPDGRRVAYMVMSGDGIAVVVDGEKGEVFEGVASGSLVFSPDGKHLAYVGTRPGKQYVVLDGKPFEYRGISKQGVVFSPDGARYAWVAAKEGGQAAVIDGQESALYGGIAAQGVIFSPDGKRYGYSASSAGKYLVILDGEEGALFDSVAGFKFSERGQHAVHVGIREGKWFGVVNGVPYGPFDELRSLSSAQKGGSPEKMADAFEISADGSRVGFVGKRGDEWFVVVDGKEVGPYTGCTGLALSPEGSRVAYLATRGEGWFMMIDGVEQSFHALESLSFSPDGKRLASIVKRGEKRLALIDGKEGKEYDKIDAPGIRFSPDGKHTAYLAELAGDKMVVVDGVEGQRFKRLGKTALSYLPNGSRLFYSVRRGEKREALVVDGVEGPAVSSYRSLTFSPDGSRYAYVAEKEENHFVVVLDGVEYGPNGKLQPGDTRAYTKVAKGPPTFSADSRRVGWVAVGEKGWVVVVDGKEGLPYTVVQRSTIAFSPDSQHVVFVGEREGKRMVVVDDFEIDNGWDGFLHSSDFAWEGSQRFSIRGSRNPRYLLIEVDILDGAAKQEAPRKQAAATADPFAAQLGWEKTTPSSSMRVAQFRLPGQGGAKDAELVVFSFPGGGGSVEDNLARWCAQFEQPDGRASKDVANRSQAEHDGLKLHRLELGGTYVAETSPGSGQRLNEPGWRMIGAVIEAPGQSYFVKCTGPEASVTHWRSSVDAFLAGLRL